jgi:hypothetical protein
MLFYPHWLILSPCLIRLPFRIEEGERLAWHRLAEYQWDSLQIHSGRKGAMSIRWDCMGETLPRTLNPVNGEGSAIAFSGGKDSLFQVGFLAAQGQNPLLVTTLAPPPPVHPRRLFVYEEMQRRSGLPMMKIQTDYRSSYHNRYPLEQGWNEAVNEVSDVLLYAACLILAAASKNIDRLYVASELEIQAIARFDGRLIVHPHAMYNVVTLKTLERILAPYGISISSLTAPLRTTQVQQTLWREWPELRDMQTSCWSMSPDEPMCNECGQCLRITLCSLAAGFDPAEMGADLKKNLFTLKSWEKILSAARGQDARLPDDLTRQSQYRQLLYLVKSVGYYRILHYLLKQRSAASRPIDLCKAVLNATRLLMLSRNLNMPELRAFAEEFLDFVDETAKNNLRSFFEARYSCGGKSHPGNRFGRYAHEAINWCTEALH